MAFHFRLAPDQTDPDLLDSRICPCELGYDHDQNGDPVDDPWAGEPGTDNQ